MSQQDSEHYGFLTSLPFSDPQAALQEIAYAVDTLKADGFVLPTNHQGIYLSDERLDPLLKELHRRSAVVLIHPSEPVQPAFPERPQAVYEFPFDTTRAVMELIYTGKLQRYPDIRWIVSHAGGTIPYLAYRLSIVSREAEMITQEPEEVIAALRSLYYDLALSTSPLVFQVLRELVGSSHILFGTDFPMRPERGVAQSIEQFFTYPDFPANEQHLIANQTARALFPRFR